MYGQWGNEASDLDLSDPESGSSFPKDPTPEELQFLASTTNLSPNCPTGARCNEIDTDLLRQVDADYVLTLGYRHQVRYIGDYVKEIEDIIGKPVIYLDVSQTGPDCKPGKEDRCYGKSMIDLIHQIEKLAFAMGISPPASLERDRQNLCEASAAFREAAKKAHLRGVRAMAAYIVPGEDESTHLANPPDDMVLRMFEELGMPLMHVECDLKPNEETCPLGFFWETVANTNMTNFQGTGVPKYPIDFWLYDDRITLTVLDPKFGTEIYPNKAFREGQYAYWPIGGGSLSYRHAAEILNIVTPSIASAQRLYEPTGCEDGVDVSGVAHRTVGLDGGEYACYDERYHREEYLQCPSGSWSEDLEVGAIIGIVAGGIFVCFVAVAFICYRRKGEKESDTGSKPTDSDVPSEQTY